MLGFLVRFLPPFGACEDRWELNFSGGGRSPSSRSPGHVPVPSPPELLPSTAAACFAKYHQLPSKWIFKSVILRRFLLSILLFIRLLKGKLVMHPLIEIPIEGM